LDSFCVQNVQPALALAIVILACILVHLILIHRSRPGAVSSASDNHVALADVVLKDFILIPKLRNRLAASCACAHSSRQLADLRLDRNSSAH